MAENKTRPTGVRVEDFIATVPDAGRRADAAALAEMMTRLSGEPAAMWGPSIIGFGTYRYTYDSGHGGEMCRIGFSPRKAELVLYVRGPSPGYEEQLARLGKHRTGKACLYVKRLADVDLVVLEEMIADSLADNRARYPG